MDWKPGDRVRVFLPDDSSLHKRGRWFTGSVREVDPPGLRPGVRVDLDVSVNGLRDCYATHAELEPESTATCDNRKD